MKIRPVGAELFHAERRMDGQTEMTELIGTFRNFAYAPKMSAIFHMFMVPFIIIYSFK